MAAYRRVYDSRHRRLTDKNRDSSGTLHSVIEYWLRLPFTFQLNMFYTSALMLLVGRQEGHPACKKTGWWGAGMVICLERGADLHTAQLMPLLLTVNCFSKIRND